MAERMQAAIPALVLAFAASAILAQAEEPRFCPPTVRESKDGGFTITGMVRYKKTGDTDAVVLSEGDVIRVIGTVNVLGKTVNGGEAGAYAVLINGALHVAGDTLKDPQTGSRYKVAFTPEGQYKPERIDSPASLGKPEASVKQKAPSPSPAHSAQQSIVSVPGNLRGLVLDVILTGDTKATRLVECHCLCSHFFCSQSDYSAWVETPAGILLEIDPTPGAEIKRDAGDLWTTFGSALRVSGKLALSSIQGKTSEGKDLLLKPSDITSLRFVSENYQKDDRRATMFEKARQKAQMYATVSHGGTHYEGIADVVLDYSRFGVVYSIPLSRSSATPADLMADAQDKTGLLAADVLAFAGHADRNGFPLWHMRAGGKTINGFVKTRLFGEQQSPKDSYLVLWPLSGRARVAIPLLSGTGAELRFNALETASTFTAPAAVGSSPGGKGGAGPRKADTSKPQQAGQDREERGAAIGETLLLPPFDVPLNGQNEVRVRNPNDFEVTAGLRAARAGVDFAVPANGVKSVFVPDGRYDIYFVYSSNPDALFQGDSFALKGNGVEIQIVKVVGGNYGIRRVK